MTKRKFFEEIDTKKNSFLNYEPIIESQFYLTEGDKATCRLFRLYENHIVQCDRSQIALRLFHLSFDLCFYVLIRPEESDKKGQKYGINFDLLGDQFNIYSSDQVVLKEWHQILSKKLNQKGFHQQFKPIKRIGRGSFASVYLAVRITDQKRFAVKTFSKENLYAEEDGKESLQNEIQIMRMLNHRNLMQINEVFESDTSVYLCVELLEGGQLYDMIKTKHKFKAVEVLTIMRGLIQGLEHMHSKRLMHRDLKPQNILLRHDKKFECVIADFGLAAWSDQPKYLYVRCGTPGYVSPQIVNVRDLSTRFDPVCDMFSLGVIFHILVMGKSPFTGKTYNEVLTQNRACAINFESFQYSRLPQITLDLLRKLLMKNPQQRITAAEALKHEFFSRDFQLSNLEDDSDIERTTEKIFSRLSNACQSPLMTSADSSRKKGRLQADSLMKLKMQENVLTGKTETTESIDSQILPKVPFGHSVPRHSRFKRKSVKMQETS